MSIRSTSILRFGLGSASLALLLALGASTGPRTSLFPQPTSNAPHSPADTNPADQIAALPLDGPSLKSTDPEADEVAVAPPSTEEPSRPLDPPIPLPTARPLGVDQGPLKLALAHYRRGDVPAGDQAAATSVDPAGRALLEWTAIRNTIKPVSFERVAAFIAKYPDWPAAKGVRRRAEEALYSGAKSPSAVVAFFKADRPVSPFGKIALASALRLQGRTVEAAFLVRETWREDTFGDGLEGAIIERFGDALTPDDHRYRMERHLFRENWDKALRTAARAGKDHVLLAKARIAVGQRAPKAQAALDAVPSSLRADASFIFARAQHLRRSEKPVEAAAALSEVKTRDPFLLVDADEWWVERRVIARKLLDKGETRLAYSVASEHSAQSAAQRIEAEFHAGWIALRFLNEPATAAAHFGVAAKAAQTPISIARIGYWQGRAAEAQGDLDSARRHYETSAVHPITYYGQLARAKVGLGDLPVRTAEMTPAERVALLDSDAVRAVRLLYAIGERDVATGLIAELAHILGDHRQIEVLGDVLVENQDARATLVLGKTATQRGLPLERHAFPTIGIPAFEPAGREIERAIVFAIARQESAFNPGAVSAAGALGLMQLMPATARETAKRAGVNYEPDRLTSDPAYNARLGSAFLSELLDSWRGSYILTFASYNAGPGNVRKWIEAYGDPRRPGVDPIDWVERIPFAETRNYVQRVMENVQVYRSRLTARTALLIDADLRRGSTEAVRDARL